VPLPITLIDLQGRFSYFSKFVYGTYFSVSD